MISQVLKSALGRQLEVVKEVDDLFEGRIFGEVVDVVPDVGKAAFLAVDVAEGGLCGDDPLESFPISHRSPRFLRGRRGRFARLSSRVGYRGRLGAASATSIVRSTQ